MSCEGEGAEVGGLGSGSLGMTPRGPPQGDTMRLRAKRWHLGCPDSNRLVVQWEKIARKQVWGLRKLLRKEHEKAPRAGDAEVNPTKVQYVIPLKK